MYIHTYRKINGVIWVELQRVKGIFTKPRFVNQLKRRINVFSSKNIIVLIKSVC